MKTDHSLLDHFVQNALQTADADNPSVDWSEVDVLLQHEQKSVSLPTPKYIFIGAGAVALVAAVFFLVKFIGSSGNSEEQLISSDTSTALISVPDSAVNISPVPAAIDSAKPIDTTHQMTSVIPADTAEVAPEKTSEKKKTDTVNVLKKESVKTEKKKNKLSSLAPDTSKKEDAPESILPPDTQENKPEEIKNNSSGTPADTSHSLPPKKTGKSKKGKTKSTDTAAPAAPAQPDSLK